MICQTQNHIHSIYMDIYRPFGCILQFNNDSLRSLIRPFQALILCTPTHYLTLNRLMSVLITCVPNNSMCISVPTALKMYIVHLCASSTVYTCNITYCTPHRTFYAEVSSQKLDSAPAIVDSFCHTLVRNRDSWNQYQTYLLNMGQGQRILSQYGGTFFQV